MDYAIDCIDAARTQEQILYAARPGGIGLKKGGTACLVGAVQELGRIDVEELRITQRTYTGTRGSLCRPDRDFPIFVRWFQRGQLDLDALVTQRYTLEKINDATADLAGGRIHSRSIITYTWRARTTTSVRLLCLRLQRAAACGAGGVMAWERGRREGGARARKGFDVDYAPGWAERDLDITLCTRVDGAGARARSPGGRDG